MSSKPSSLKTKLKERYKLKKTKFITQGAVIAAMYTVLTAVSASVGLASGAVQIRLSEALTALPYFTPSAIPGLFVGCIVSNLVTGSAVWDIVFGSLATLIGAVITYLLRRKSKWLAPLGPIAANTLIIPFVLSAVYQVKETMAFLFVSIGAGEIISCGVFGIMLINVLSKYSKDLF